MSTGKSLFRLLLFAVSLPIAAEPALYYRSFGFQQANEFIEPGEQTSARPDLFWGELKERAERGLGEQLVPSPGSNHAPIQTFLFTEIGTLKPRRFLGNEPKFAYAHALVVSDTPSDLTRYTASAIGLDIYSLRDQTLVGRIQIPLGALKWRRTSMDRVQLSLDTAARNRIRDVLRENKTALSQTWFELNIEGDLHGVRALPLSARDRGALLGRSWLVRCAAALVESDPKPSTFTARDAADAHRAETARRDGSNSRAF